MLSQGEETHMAGRKKAAETLETPEKQEVKFTRSQLLAALKFANRKDLLEAVLTEDGLYSISDVESKIESFMEGKVR